MVIFYIILYFSIFSYSSKTTFYLMLFIYLGINLYFRGKLVQKFLPQEVWIPYLQFLCDFGIIYSGHKLHLYPFHCQSSNSSSNVNNNKIVVRSSFKIVDHFINKMS